jgi:beta-lactam-binding protein with PASTA domain
MSTKDFFNKLFSRYLMYHLLAMAVVVVLLCVGVKFGLDLYTHHGEGIPVPDVKGLSFDKASQKLTDLGLAIVVSDSGYNKQMPADAVLAQTPGRGQRVKQGHIVYVTVNSPSSPTFAIPDVVDNSSYREAEAKLVAIGFKLEPPQQVEGEKDWVYGILCRGRRVSTGDRISIDTPLTLLIGNGHYSSDEAIDYIEPEEKTIQEGEPDEFEEVVE